MVCGGAYTVAFNIYASRHGMYTVYLPCHSGHAINFCQIAMSDCTNKVAKLKYPYCTKPGVFLCVSFAALDSEAGLPLFRLR